VAVIRTLSDCVVCDATLAPTSLLFPPPADASQIAGTAVATAMNSARTAGSGVYRRGFAVGLIVAVGSCGNPEPRPRPIAGTLL
jgi:hypothetical protein